MFRSKYGDPPDELISFSVRRRIRGNLRNKVLHQAVEEAERNSILERMKKNPALAAEAKRLARNVTQEIEARKHQSEGVSSENFPKQMIKDPQSSSSDTHLISLVQEVKPTESQKLGNGRIPKAILEQERKKMEASLLTIQVGDMRRHLLKRRIDEELAKAERLRTRNQRKNQAKRLRRMQRELGLQKDNTEKGVEVHESSSSTSHTNAVKISALQETSVGPMEVDPIDGMVLDYEDSTNDSIMGTQSEHTSELE